MVVRRLVYAALVLVASAATACASCSTPEQNDAGADALLDASPTPEAATVICDASFWDGGIITDWPGFRRLTEFSPCCQFDVATDLTALPLMNWIPCTNGATACIEWQKGWAYDGGVGYFFRGPEVARGSNGIPATLLLGFSISSQVAEYGIYDLTSQKAIGGTRIGSASQCPVAADLAGAGATIFGSYAPAGAAVVGAQGSITQTLSAPQFRTLAPAGSLPKPSVIQTETASAVRFAFDVQPQGIVAQWPFDGGALVQSKNTTGAALLLDFVEGDDVYALSVHGTAGWQQEYLVEPDGSVVLYQSSPSAHVAAFASDGVSIFWTESYGNASQSGAQPNTDLWSATYTNSPSILASSSKKLTSLPVSFTPGAGIAFSGYYATAPNPFTTAYVVRASDGAMQQVASGHRGGDFNSSRS